MKRNGFVSLLIVAMLMITVACSGGTGGNTGTKETNAPSATNTTTEAGAQTKELIDMRFMVFGTTDQYVKQNFDLIAQRVKEEFNVNLNFEFADRNTYQEKLNVAIAGGNAPDIFFTNDLKFLTQAIQNGAVVPLDDYVQNDPEFSQLDPGMFIDSTMNGKIYTLPKAGITPLTLYYRTDWVEKLGLSTPSTPDELFEMLKAFAQNDPDGDDKNNTFGFTMNQDFNNSDPFWMMFVQNKPAKLGLYVDEEQGTVKSSLLDIEGMKKALAWFSKANAEKVLDPEWVLDKPASVEDKFITGKTGVFSFQPQFILPRHTKITAQFPEANIAVLPSVQGEKYNNYRAKMGYKLDYYVSNTTKDKERAAQVLGFFASEEGQRLTSLGQEGVTYKVENGELVFLDDQLSKLYNPGLLLTSVFEHELPVPVPVLEGALEAVEGYGMYVDTEKLIANSELAAKKMADIDKMSREAITKIILGQSPIDSYDELVKNVKKEGIEQILEELTTIYKNQ
ncbi:extracellular solute-binding protein [Paenibacillus sp. PL2-23]|uniref:extracellular solute-binding protein n=1 Tax=Paenibacillus sp. PL2-23 TaxID=2100729 RepID=UPI0030F6F511